MTLSFIGDRDGASSTAQIPQHFARAQRANAIDCTGEWLPDSLRNPCASDPIMSARDARSATRASRKASTTTPATTTTAVSIIDAPEEGGQHARVESTIVAPIAKQLEVATEAVDVNVGKITIAHDVTEPDVSDDNDDFDDMPRANAKVRTRCHTRPDMCNTGLALQLPA